MTAPEQQRDADPARASGSECYGDTCITCSDEATPVVLVELLPFAMARADTGSGIEEVSIALVDARVGDTVLVHAREAIAVLGAADGAVTDTLTAGGAQL